MKKIKENEIRWGIIGVGAVCEVKSAPAMNLIKHSRIEAVMRRDPAKAEDYAKRHGVEKWYREARELVLDPRVNAIYIATPPNAHMEYTLLAAEIGKPVYVEKPMARTYAECIKMIEACNHQNVPLYVAYYRRALPNFLKVKSLVESGVIGEARLVEIRMCKPPEPEIVSKTEHNWRINPKIAGGGYFYDLASHQLDFLDYVFGPIIKASGFPANQANLYAAEDIVIGSFEFESGVLGTGSWCFTSNPASEKDITTIIGSKGEISFESFGTSEVKLTTNEGHEIFTFDLPKHIQQPLIQQVVDDLLGVGGCVSTGPSAARTNRAMELLTST